MSRGASSADTAIRKCLPDLHVTGSSVAAQPQAPRVFAALRVRGQREGRHRVSESENQPGDPRGFKQASGSRLVREVARDGFDRDHDCTRVIGGVDQQCVQIRRGARDKPRLQELLSFFVTLEQGPGARVRSGVEGKDDHASGCTVSGLLRHLATVYTQGVEKIRIYFAVANGDRNIPESADVEVEHQLSTDELVQWLMQARSRGYFVDNKGEVWTTEYILSVKNSTPPQVAFT
jgi:hypothetical protein